MKLTVYTNTDEAARVRLRYGPQPGSDYINASFIDVSSGHYYVHVLGMCFCESTNHYYIAQGYKHRKAYIAAQGPLQNTVNDFWRMVWEHHCSCIVILCDTEENDMAYTGQRVWLALIISFHISELCVLNLM